MTDFVFDASASRRERDWDDPASWYGGVVPNMLDADVSFVTIQSSESHAVQSVTITNNFFADRRPLRRRRARHRGQRGIGLFGSTLTFGSLINDGTDIQGYGCLATVNALDNAGTFIGGDATGPITDAASFCKYQLRIGRSPISNLDNSLV